MKRRAGAKHMFGVYQFGRDIRREMRKNEMKA